MVLSRENHGSLRSWEWSCLQAENSISGISQNDVNHSLASRFLPHTNTLPHEEQTHAADLKEWHRKANYVLIYKESFLKKFVEKRQLGTVYLKIKAVFVLWKKDRSSKSLHALDSTWIGGGNAYAGELQELYCASNYCSTCHTWWTVTPWQYIYKGRRWRCGRYKVNSTYASCKHHSLLMSTKLCITSFQGILVSDAESCTALQTIVRLICESGNTTVVHMSY